MIRPHALCVCGETSCKETTSARDDTTLGVTVVASSGKRSKTPVRLPLVPTLHLGTPLWAQLNCGGVRQVLIARGRSVHERSRSSASPAIAFPSATWERGLNQLNLHHHG